MASWAVGGLRGVPGKVVRGVKGLYCPKAPNISYFLENCNTTKKSLFLATPFK